MAKGLFCCHEMGFILACIIHLTEGRHRAKEPRGIWSLPLSLSLQNETRGNFLSDIVCAPGAMVIGDRRTALQCRQLFSEFLLRQILGREDVLNSSARCFNFAELEERFGINPPIRVPSTVPDSVGVQTKSHLPLAQTAFSRRWRRRRRRRGPNERGLFNTLPPPPPMKGIVHK